MPNQIKVTATTANTTKIPEFQHVITQVWQSGTLNSATGQYETVFGNIPAGNYANLIINGRLVGTTQVVNFAAGTLTVLGGVMGTDTRTNIDPATGPPDVAYEAPLTVLSSMAGSDGVIRISNRNFASTSTGTSAISFNCGKTRVVLTNVVAKSPGTQISGGTDSNVQLIDVACYNTNPVMDGLERNRNISFFKPYSVEAQYITMESGGGFYIDHWNGDNSAASIVKLRNFRVRNVIGKNGAFRHAIQLSNCRTKNLVIEYIEVFNEENKSRTEDTINFYNSGGWDADNFALCQGFYLDGAFPYGATATTFTGAQLSADGSGQASELPSAYIKITDAWLVRACGAAANIATGNDISYKRLYIVSNGYLNDGTRTKSAYRGCWIGDYYNLGPGTNNSMSEITTRFMRTKDTIRRADFVADPNVTSDVPNAGIDVANAVFLPDVADLAAAREQERQAFLGWRDYLNQQNQTCGKRP